MKVFQWRKRGYGERPSTAGLQIPTETEELIGQVLGRSATDIEERMFYGFINNGVDEGDIDFQPTLIGGRYLPGEVRPDFATYSPFLQIWYADGEYYHKTQAQKDHDKFQDAVLMQMYEVEPIRITGEDLQTQEDADREVGEYLG